MIMLYEDLFFPQKDSATICHVDKVDKNFLL